MKKENEEYIDEALRKKYVEYENRIKEFSKEEISDMINIAKSRKKVKIYKIATVSICASFIFVLCLGIFLHRGVNVSENETNVTKEAAKTENNNSDESTYIAKYNMMLSSTEDYSDVNVLKKLADYIVIAKVKKIDGAINYSEGLQMYTSVNTIGEIEIIKNIKGILKENDILPFIRLDGTIKTEEYIKGLPENNINLLKKAQEEGADNILNYEYVKILKDDNIDIEEGKTYVMFISYDEYNQRYEIFGEQYGLREYNLNNNTVLNNMTGEWEDLDSLNLK